MAKDLVNRSEEYILERLKNLYELAFLDGTVAQDIEILGQYVTEPEDINPEK
jgi:hypothetical protein